MESEYKYMVMIKCFTYQHVNYIEDALKGFVMQQTNFPFIAVVVDDHSTDGTTDIVRRYAEQYQDIIHSICLEENYYSQRKPKWPLFQDIEKQAKYIAVCEGDDYWTDPLKLQKQVDFMETNDDFSICFHAAKIWKEKEKILVDDFVLPEVPEITTIYDFANSFNYIHTNTILFRNNPKAEEQRRKLGRLGLGDYPTFFMHAQYGKIYKIKECMGVYRYGSGTWSTKNEHSVSLELCIMFCKLYSLVEDEKLKSIIENRISILRTNLITFYSNVYKENDGLKKSLSYRLGYNLLQPLRHVRRLFKK